MTRILVFVLLLSGLTGCASSGGGGGASCALTLSYHRHVYFVFKTAKPVVGTRPLLGAHYSACFDHNHITAAERAEVRRETRTHVPARALPGIDPRVAFAVPSVYRRYVFYAGRPDTSPAEMPSALRRLLSR